MSKKVIIIGAGLTGLSAGIHLQQNGVETEIFELAGQAGGMCTTWVREGYRFDGCIHWMVGTKPGTGIHKLYREVDALQANTPIFNAPNLAAEVNRTFYEIPLNLKGFRDFLLSLAPEDSMRIEDFCANIDIMAKTEMPLGSPSGLLGLARMMLRSGGFMKLAVKYGKLQVKDFVESLENGVLKRILYSLFPADYSLFALYMMLGTRMSGNAGYPLGGALDVIKRMVSKYVSLGGKCHFNARVDEIVVENGKAAGIKTKGTFHKADAVIAACDMYDTLHRMLGGRYKHPQLDTLLESASLFHPLCVVSFGLKKRFGLPFSTDFECPEGIETAPGFVMDRLSINSYEFDPASAPQNCSSVMVMLPAPLDYWQNLRKDDRNAYNQRKSKLADDVRIALESKLPGFSDAVAVTDVATPATYVRYANLFKGSWEGFEPKPDVLRTNISKTIPGIDHLLLAGQWTTIGGGICTAVSDGKVAAYRILRGK